MRFMTIFGLCIALSISLIQGEEDKSISEDATIRERILVSTMQANLLPPDALIGGNSFRRESEVRMLKNQSWFKPVVLLYWFVAAVDSYNDKDEFRLASRMPRERNVSAGFDIGTNGSRIVFDPRRPLIIFPLGRHSHLDRLWALQIKNHGGAITFAINLNATPSR